MLQSIFQIVFFAQIYFAAPVPQNNVIPFIPQDAVVSSATSNITGLFKCNGINDHEQIQMAIDLIKRAGGGVVRLTDGVFTINAQLNLSSNLVLVGDGIERTIIKLAAGARPFKFGSSIAAGVARGFRV